MNKENYLLTNYTKKYLLECAIKKIKLLKSKIQNNKVDYFLKRNNYMNFDHKKNDDLDDDDFL